MVPDFGDRFMSNTLTTLLAFADNLERRAHQLTDLAKQAELIDLAVRSRFLTSEIVRIFDLVKKLEGD